MNNIILNQKIDDVDKIVNNEIERAKTAENTLTSIINTNSLIWEDKYTKNETDNKISAVVTSLDYKEHVAKFSDLATIYPTPDKGWTVSVDEDGYTYKYNGTTWIPISANSIPLATETQDGKMSKQDKIDHDDMLTKMHTHGNKTIIDAITSDTVTSWNGAVTHETDTVKHITADERTKWNTVDNKTDVGHKHVKADITDFPTSLPANGGNADTLDSKHAADIVTDSFNSITIGGRNYVPNSSYFTWMGTGKTNECLSPCNLTKDLSGQTVTFSFNYSIASDATFGSSALLQIQFSGNYNWAGNIDTIPLISPKSDKVSFTVTLPNRTVTSNKDIWLRSDNITGKIEITNLKVEIGNKATDWTPAPEDTQTAIDAVQVGGRNVILGSKSFTNFTSDAYGGNAGTTITTATTDIPTGLALHGCSVFKLVLNNSGFRLLNNVTTVAPGTYTFSAWMYVASGYTGTPGIYLTATNRKYYDTTKLGTWQKLSVTITVSSIMNVECAFAPIWGENATGTIFVTMPKLEFGVKATDYTEAPDDIQSQIDSVTTNTNTLKNTTVPAIDTRLITIEQKTTDDAIISTVTDSITYNRDTMVPVTTPLQVTRAGLAINPLNCYNFTSGTAAANNTLVTMASGTNMYTPVEGGIEIFGDQSATFSKVSGSAVTFNSNKVNLPNGMYMICTGTEIDFYASDGTMILSANKTSISGHIPSGGSYTTVQS